MWKTQLSRAVKEVRFVLKNGVEHHGTWRFVNTRLNELKMLNQYTFFSLEEIQDVYDTPSAVHFVFGDLDNTQHHVETSGLTDAALEKILKEKVALGLTLRRRPIPDNSIRGLPPSIVEAQKYTHYIDDAF